ncbi:MAG: hypothetical protein PHQ40_17405, partial [Anaerolineaceae bacterium]|nr:hypothetical protein [Anaerolineaceae bacterium]
VSVSDDDTNLLAVPPLDPTNSINKPEGEKGEETRDDPIHDHSFRRKPVRGVRASRNTKRKLGRPGS